MSKSRQSWIKVLKFMIDKEYIDSLAILYPISRTNVASLIGDAASEIGIKTIKLEVNPHKDFEEAPPNLTAILDNLKTNDFLIVIRGDNFINKMKLNDHFNTFSGLINSDAKSIVLHMLIDNKNLTYLCDINYKEIMNYTEKMKNKLNNASKIRIKTPLGTDITFRPRKWKEMTIKPTELNKNALLPAGQIYTAPQEKNTNGTLIIDRFVSEFPIDFKNIIAFPPLENEIKLTIKNGKITEVEGRKEAEFLENECLSKVDIGGLILGEVTLGTNPKRSQEKNIGIQEILRSTVHFGFGLNTHLGGDIVSNVHWDGVIEMDHSEIEIIE
ncbi:MAG: aminopeptidase [Candidatus Thorarchaeota archaeon]